MKWTDFDVPKVRTINRGSENGRYLGVNIYEIIPTDITELDTIDKFKVALTKWKAEFCLCRLCKVYLQNIGYMFVYYLKKESRNIRGSNQKFFLLRFFNFYVFLRYFYVIT